MLHSIKQMIADESEHKQRKMIILDELSFFADSSLLPILAAARSFGYQVILASQSIADLRKVSPEFADALLENCNQYTTLRLNNSEDAETMSAIFGTYDSIETTFKTAHMMLDSAGAGTKKVVREFKVHPDTIKTLPNLRAVYYGKTTGVLQEIKIPFVQV